jgi:hypothetical protein
VWTIILLEEVQGWLSSLDDRSYELVVAALDLLSDEGPQLGRPLVDRIKGSSLQNLKELRPGSTGRTELRLLFVFDPKRNAVVLVGGDKSSNWSKWYVANIAIAEARFSNYIKGLL